MSIRDTGWMNAAACRQHPDLGWIAEPELVGLGEEATMGVVCEGCPVRAECAAHAARFAVTAGFWAGHHHTPAGPWLPIAGDAA